ncbi:MAG: hypothetical protein FJ290_25275 [Planctomycetes bacterium]|nr:hypothetical protein [Planctomycetota bacterium]
MRATRVLTLLFPSAVFAAGIDALPVNQWVKLDTKKEPGYAWSATVYVPSRGQVLHWGAAPSGTPEHDDVRAFDTDKLEWVSDYPSAPADVLRKAVDTEDRAKSVRIWGRWAMLDTGRPAPSWVLNAVTYDSKRRQLVYVLKGMMAAYDPEKRTWRDMKAETELHGKWSLNPTTPYGMYERGLRPEQDFKGERIPGPPPVYGAGICYDPVNDEILLFPHWGSQNNDLRSATGEVAAHSGTWVYSFADNLWRRDTMRDGKPRLQPPPRCGAPMVYDPKARAIVLFGGQSGLVRSDIANPGRAPEPGALNDLWIYYLATRQWREVPFMKYSPEQGQPKLAHDEALGLTFLVTLPKQYAGKGRITLWSLGAAKGWSKRHEEPWPHGDTSWASLALDPKNRLLLLVRDSKDGQETFAFRLDLDNLPPQPATAWGPRPPIAPQEVPPHDPAWLAKLKELPANTWVPAKPPREPERRDWGMMAADPVRGLVFYFGGGHSTYQVNDVAVYAPGANRWCHTAGDSNFPLPPHDWDGCTMSTRGGPPAGHQRNSYVALDGRMFVHAGTHSRRWDAETAKEKGTRVAWFWDLDRGGVWRQREIAEVALGEGVPGSYGRLHVADPSGKLYGFAGHLEPYDGRFFTREAYFSTYDARENKLSVRRIPEPTPGWVGECRPFCMLPDRQQVFFYEFRKGGGHNTWVYDIKENRFINLKPKRQPGEDRLKAELQTDRLKAELQTDRLKAELRTGDPRTVEYVESQKCVFAVIGRNEQWVYSFERNDWAPLPLKAEGERFGFQTPYAQLVWVAHHGVLVNFAGTTCLLRPDFSQVKWE